LTGVPRPARFGALLSAALVRFGLGSAGAVAAGLLAFRDRLFEPGYAAFDCLVFGVLLAGILTLVRLSLRLQAVALVAAFGVVRAVTADSGGWSAGIAAVLAGGGFVVVAEIYHELAGTGFRFGKFLIVGPLAGGVLLAVAPILDAHALIPLDAVRPLLQRLFLGVVAGDGAGLGVELAELLPWNAVAAAPALAPEAERIPGGGGTARGDRTKIGSESAR